MYIQTPSPNFNHRDCDIDTIVIHSTHINKAESLSRLCNPTSQVSCHYLIDFEGNIFQLVQEQYRAWHAGKSFWRGKYNLNDNSIGIELLDTDDSGQRTRFSNAQMQSLIQLLKKLVQSYKIKSYNIVAHSDIAPDRKDDPGEHFDWLALYKEGIGVFHDIPLNSPKGGVVLSKANSMASKLIPIQKQLQDIGYLINADGAYSAQTHHTIIAFKRHFNPYNISDELHTLDLDILSNLTRQNLA